MKQLAALMFLALALMATAFGQDATVVVFTPEEAQTVKAAADKLATAQKEFDASVKSLIQKYRKSNAIVDRYADIVFWHFAPDYKAMVPYWDYARLPTSEPCPSTKAVQ